MVSFCQCKTKTTRLPHESFRVLSPNESRFKLQVQRWLLKSARTRLKTLTFSFEVRGNELLFTFNEEARARASLLSHVPAGTCALKGSLSCRYVSEQWGMSFSHFVPQLPHLILVARELMMVCLVARECGVTPVQQQLPTRYLPGLHPWLWGPSSSLNRHRWDLRLSPWHHCGFHNFHTYILVAGLQKNLNVSPSVLLGLSVTVKCKLNHYTWLEERGLWASLTYLGVKRLILIMIRFLS